MAEHVININPLSPTSIMRAYNKYLKIRKEFDEKVYIFLERLAESGKETFDLLGYTPDSGEITVTVEQIDHGYCINAAGKGIVFLEFGAGDMTIPDKYASMMPFPIYPGAYSEHNAGMYENWHYWIFGGVKYTEIIPRFGMETAWMTVMEQWRNIAEEVFA